MSERFTFFENELYIVLQVAGDGDVRLLHAGTRAFDIEEIPKADRKAFRLVELQCAGFDANSHHGDKHTGTQPGALLKYVSHQDVRTPQGRKLMITQAFEDLVVTSYLQMYDNIRALRSWTVVRNNGPKPYVLEHVSSFALTGIDQPGVPWQQNVLAIPANSWCAEAQWRKRSLAEWGMESVVRTPIQRVRRLSTGAWTSKEFLPMGCLETASGAIAWQIEHNGSWQWEMSGNEGRLTLELSGPSWQENHWRNVLEPGESFTSVPAAVTFGDSFDSAIGEMTRYRRVIRRPSEDHHKLPVLYSDRHVSEDDLTRDKELARIQAAAKLGCETYCLDAGWFAAGVWWEGVGEWMPSATRFPNGLGEVVAAIRAHGMTPGLWLEPEVMGVHASLAAHLPVDWCFQIAGKPVIDHGRYQLDFRNPDVVQHADAAIDRLVTEEGIRYLKLDYNIEPGVGTEHNASASGEGLLEHNRAYLAWLDRLLARYPWLTLENAASGGLRMEYALLTRHAVQAVSEQTSAKELAAIAAACPSAVTPEQAGIFCAPQAEEDQEAVALRMVNALLLRPQISGEIDAFSSAQRSAIEEGIAVHKKLREHIRTGVPMWPLGLPRMDAGQLCLALVCEDRTYVATWRLTDEAAKQIAVPIAQVKGKTAAVRTVYPSFAKGEPEWDAEKGILTVPHEKAGTARVVEVVVG